MSISNFSDQRIKESTLKSYSKDTYRTNVTNLEDAKWLELYLREKAADAGNYRGALNAKNEIFELIEKSISEANNEITSELKEIINKKIKESFGRQQLSVEDIDNSIVLKGKEKGSGAEKTITVTSFALSLLERSKVDFPLVIDHPVITVMLESRSALSKFMSGLNHQVICFVINAEKDGFITKSGKVLPFLDNSKFITAGRLEQVTVDGLPKGTQKSKNGFITHDDKFFHEFEIENEDQK